MRQIQCEQCSETFDLNSTYRIEGRDLCGDCGQAYFNEHPETPGEAVVRNYDPNFCVQCNKDFPEAELPILAGLPCCDACSKWLRNRPFPGWIKAGLAGLLALVALSFVWNWRFVEGYLQMKASFAEAAVGNVEAAASKMTAAAESVPEQPFMASFAKYLTAADLVQKGRNAEAIPLLEACRSGLPEPGMVDELMMSAKIGLAFDAGDYNEFLRLATVSAGQNPQSAHHLGQVASANACKYAETGDVKYRIAAMDTLDAARRLTGGADPYFNEYSQRILHRLHTKEIISRSEFVERFPNGWTAPEQETSE